MAELVVRDFKDYDTQIMGKPWAAIVKPNGRYDFDKVMTGFTGDLENGTAGSLVILNAAEGITYATGQKNRLTKESNMQFYRCTGNSFEEVNQSEVKEKIDRNIAAVVQAEAEKVKSEVAQKIENFRKSNTIVTLETFSNYDTKKKSTPWIVEYTKDGLSFDGIDNLDAKPVGRVLGNAGEYMEVVAINPTPEQVFAVGQKDLESGRHRVDFYEIDENHAIKKLSRQAANHKLGIENSFQPFQVEDESKIVLDMPSGYDAEKYSLWVAKMIQQADGSVTFASKAEDGKNIGNYSGGNDGQPGQFYVSEPEENATYAVFQREYGRSTKMIAKVQYNKGKMLERPLRSAEIEEKRKVIQSFGAFDEEKFENPYVGKITGTGKIRYAMGKNEYGRTLHVGGYTGRKGLGEAGDVYVWNPQEGDVYAVCQRNNQTLRTDVNFYEYSKEKFIALDREAAVEHAKRQEETQSKQQTTATQDQQIIENLQKQLKTGEALSEDQIKSLEIYRQKYAQQKESLQMVAENSEIVLAKIEAYDPQVLKNPYVSKRGLSGRFDFIDSPRIGPEGGEIVIQNAKDGDVYAFGQARQDGQKQPARYAVIHAGQSIIMEQAEYQEWKKGQGGKQQDKQVSLLEAMQSLAAKGIEGEKAQQALLAQNNIKEFMGKTAAQKNQIVSKSLKKEQNQALDISR